MARGTRNWAENKGGLTTFGEVRVLWMAALCLAAESRVTPKSEEIVKVLLAIVVEGPVSAAIARKQLAGQLSFCEPWLEELERRGGVAEGGEIKSGSMKGADGPSKDGEIRGNEMPEREALERLREKILVTGEDPGSRSSAAQELAEGICVSYAGLVLLHPFLVSFFSRLGLVIENGFANEAARERGVHLMQYLATSETEMPEYELIMAKALCAYPIETPVARTFEPTSEEIEEAGALLDACLSQWTVLQNTSRDGLRGSFLSRAGRLYRKEGRLRLEVEQSSIDVLLDYLPWNLSLVKLPWMQEMLYVNWR